jgi:hypothetical protein
MKELLYVTGAINIMLFTIFIINIFVDNPVKSVFYFALITINLMVIAFELRIIE